MIKKRNHIHRLILATFWTIKKQIHFMPTISIFYGITVMMYFLDNKEHHTPHFHVRYGEHEASISIKTGEILAGSFPGSKLKLIQAWAAIHEDELNINWKMACEGQPVDKIEPLK